MEDPGDLRLGDHICWAFRSDGEHRRVLTRFLSEGIRAGERVLFLGSPVERATLAPRYLRRMGYDGDQLIRDGRLVIGGAPETYIPNGSFDPDAQIAEYGRMVQQALQDGYSGLRVAAETSWLASHEDALDVWPSYELRADILATRMPFLALCCYDERAWDSTTIGLMQSVHALSLNGHGQTSAGFSLHGSVGGGIAVAGEVDFLQADRLGSILGAAVKEAGLPVLDVSRLDFADVAGIRALAHAASEMLSVHGSARIDGVSPTFKKVWDLLGLDPLIPAAPVAAR